MPKAGSRRRKKHTHLEEAGTQGGAGYSGDGVATRPTSATIASEKVPKSLVIRRGKHTAAMRDLQASLRKVFLPNTALNLRETKTNTLKDFVDVSGTFGITHLVLLTATETSKYLKIGRVPKGPTVSFKISRFSLISDIKKVQKRPRDHSSSFHTPPLVVLSGFQNVAEGKEGKYLTLVSTILQNAFPPIDVNTVSLQRCRRVLLFQRDEATGEIEMRHYEVQLRASGVHRGIRSLTDRHQALPNLSKYQTLSDWVEAADGYGSDSDAEGANAKVEIPGGANGRGGPDQCKVRLHEIGPRLSMHLWKIEEGLCSGEVLYHAGIEKSANDVEKTKIEHEERKRLKIQRRQEQEENVKRKAMLAKSKARGDKLKAGGPSRRDRFKADNKRYKNEPQNIVDDDVEYYRQEVGEEPDRDFVRSTREHKSVEKPRDGKKRRPEWLENARRRKKGAQ